MNAEFVTDYTARVAYIRDDIGWYAAPIAPVRGILDAWELVGYYEGPYKTQEDAKRALDM